MCDTPFELIYIVVQSNKNQFKTFLQERAGAFGIGTGKEPQKPRPKVKTMYIIYLMRIFALPAI